MKAVYVIALLAFFASNAHCQNMTLMSGQVIALNELYKASNSSCCIPRSTLGDYTPVVRMDGSNGQFYVTADPDCKTSPIQTEAYPANYEAIWACGKCAGGKCPTVDGGLNVALPSDWCVDQNNKQDPNIVCSTQAPVCDEGYSGKCIAVPSTATQAVSGPSITLQSGQVVDLNKLAQQYQGQCCLPRTVINDFTPIVRLDNSNGNYFVSYDSNCNGPITNDLFPAMFEYIHVCDECPPGGCYQDQVTIINGGITLVEQGGNCNPYNYYGAGCWGAAPMCAFGINQCIGIPYYADRYYNDYCYSTFDCGGGGWGGWGWGDYGYYRPIWWRPCYPIYRPGWWRPPIIRPRPPGPWWPIRPCPADWRPGRFIPGWRPGHRPINWKPNRDIFQHPSGWKHGRDNDHIIRPGQATVGGRFGGKLGRGDQVTQPPKPDSGVRAGPGVIPVKRPRDNAIGNPAGIGVGAGGIRQGQGTQGQNGGRPRPSDVFQGGGLLPSGGPGRNGGPRRGQGQNQGDAGTGGAGSGGAGTGGNQGNVGDRGPRGERPALFSGAGNGGAGNGGAGNGGAGNGGGGTGAVNPVMPSTGRGTPTITEDGAGPGRLSPGSFVRPVNRGGGGGGSNQGAGAGLGTGNNFFGPAGNPNSGAGNFNGGPRGNTAPSFFTPRSQSTFVPSGGGGLGNPRGFTNSLNPARSGFNPGGGGGGGGGGRPPWLYQTTSGRLGGGAGSSFIPRGGGGGRRDRGK